MNRWRRILFFLLLNIIVSACTVVLVLTVWTRSFPLPLGSLPVLSGETPEPPSTELEPEVFPDASGRHVVQRGDTLEGIAARYGITLQALLAFNGLSDSALIGPGDVLRIPAAESPVAPAEATDPEPAPTLPPLDAEIEIEITAVIAPGVLADERIQIQYQGAGELSLLNWRLEDADGQNFVFPDLTLFNGGAVSIYTKAGANSAVELYWGRTEPVWEPGDTAVLRDPLGGERAVYQVP